MKITVKNADLSRELNLLEKIVGKKVTIAVLGNVLIQASMGHLILSATDLEIGLVGACEADVEEAGAVTLPAKKLMEMVRAQTADTLTLASDKGGAVKLSSGKFSSRLQSLPATDFPGIPTIDGHPSITLPRAGLKDMIAQVRYAMSEKDQRYYLRGANMALNENELRLVTTDGARLSLTATKRDGPAWETCLIPDKALDELSALLAEPGNDDIVFAKSERHMFFDLDGRLLISRLVDGKFPAYDKIIPKHNIHPMELDRHELIPVLKRLLLIDEVVVLTLDTDSLEVSSRSADVGDGEELVSVSYTGPRMELKYKGQYILDFLNAATGQRVTLSVKDAETAALFTDGDYLNVVMGMRN